MMNTNLELQNVASNSGGFFNVPGGGDDSLGRHGNLEIEYYEESDTFGIYPNGEIFPPVQPWKANILIRELDVFRYAEKCREKWRENTVELRENGSYPFQSTLVFTERLDFIKRVCGQLAVAGSRLFFNIFERDKDNERLCEIAKQLRTKSIEQQLILTITSKDFFIPWGMIYTHPHADVELEDDGSNFDWEGFWGYRHIIEHNPEWIGRDNVLERNEEHLICASMNLDENLDADLAIQSVARQKRFFKHLVKEKILDYHERSLKQQLQEAIEANDFSDRILYFYCHGKAADELGASQIMLTDKLPIDEDDIAFWLRDHAVLKTHPLIFINACKGGRMNTMFFKTFAAELLERRARGLIGPQIDIPAEFAAEYAERLFTEFLTSARPPEEKLRLGRLMHDLTHEFKEKYNNPLGLVYSLYRGLDVYVDRTPVIACDAH